MTKIRRGRFGNPTYEQKLLWAPIYEAVLNILGTTGVIIPLGDTNHENAGRTTVDTIGEEQVTFTYSEAITAFDTTPTLKGPAKIPIIDFNGTDEEADSPDAAYWTPSADGDKFSVGAWVLPDAADGVILSKWDDTSASEVREWVLYSQASGYPELLVYDETNDAQLGRHDATALSTTAWSFVVGTYDGGTASSGINVYLDGTATDDTDNNSGAGYANIQDTAQEVKLGCYTGTGGTDALLFDGEMAGGPLAPFWVPGELTADQVKRLYNIGRVALDV